MPTELKMPALSPTMESGTLAKWLVAEGEWVKAGDVIAEIETDKATMEFEADSDGRIARLAIAEGAENVAVGTVIALLAEEGEQMPTADRGGSEARAERALEVRRRSPPADRITVSPLAGRIAAAKNIDLSGKTGSGPGGRIVRADLGPFSTSGSTRFEITQELNEAAPNVFRPLGDLPVEAIPLNSMRRTIAQRLSASKRTIPHFYLTVRCNIDALLRLRGELNATLVERGVKLTLNDLLMKAMAIALREVPEAHVHFCGDVIHRLGRVDIAMAVALDGGLVTPVIRDVDQMSLSAIARTARSLVEKARSGRLMPDEYEGGSVSISNLGMFGTDEMIPVINPPQALILGIGAGREQPWSVEGDIRLATIMAATASFDHRAIDGATGAQFLSSFREIIQSPLRLAA